MAKKIVFLNLADMHEHGLALTSVNALKRKYPERYWITEQFAGKNQVTLINLFHLLHDHRNPRRITSLNDLTAAMPLIVERITIRRLCAEADKIMLGVHGRYDDQEHGFAGLGWEQGSGPIGSCSEFAKLVGDLLLSGRSYRLSLIVCFGARSGNYSKNHDDDLTEEDIKSSFAYRFYQRICTEADVTMTARTGSVGFDPGTGKSLVQTEAAVEAEIEYGRLQTTAKEQGLTDKWYETLLERYYQRGELQQFRDIESRMTAPNAQPLTEDERLVHTYWRLVEVKRTIDDRKSVTRGKYGKFVYSYDSSTQTVTVSRKYTGGVKTMTPLYVGPL